MENYRELNTEMAREVQTMRMNLRLYCEEIFRLKAELMQKHETEINFRMTLYKVIMEKCLQLTEMVKPDADIIPVLKESVIDLNRSKKLSAELRRSNSIISTRNSLRSISPIRSRTVDENMQAEHRLTNEQTGNLNVIYEESNDEMQEEEEASEEVVSVNTDEDESESIAEVSDVSNTHATSKSANCSTSEIDEDTLQEPRRSSRTRALKMTNRSIPTSHNSSGEDATIASINFCVEEATSSTPNSRRLPLSPSTDCVKDLSTSSMSARPVRQCRPKFLAEPNLKSKLRNETSEILRGRRKNK